MPTESLQLLRACLASVLVMIAAVADPQAIEDQPAIDPVASLCTAASPLVPRTITLTSDVQRPIEAMLKRSPTFREQCRRIAAAPWLHVLVRLNPQISDTGCRARSVIQKTGSGIIVAIVELAPAGNPVPWIAHEFEHLIEQLDGLRLHDLAAHRRGVWRTSGEAFETERAIRAGRQVADEIGRKATAPNIFVE